MIPFTAGETKDAFFQNRIAAIPKRQRETNLLVTIADARESVFIPPVSARPCVIVWEIVPRRAIRAIVFTHGSPRALAEIWTPAFPVLRLLTGFFQPLFFGGKAFRFLLSVHLEFASISCSPKVGVRSPTIREGRFSRRALAYARASDTLPMPVAILIVHTRDRCAPLSTPRRKPHQ